MGTTWPKLGLRCAPNSLILLNIGPTKANIGVTYAPQTQVGRRPAVRRKPLNPGAGHEARALPAGPSVVTEGYRRSPPQPPTLVTNLAQPRAKMRAR